MNSHRYRYLYLPLARYLERYSPGSQKLLIAAQIGLIAALIAFKLITDSAVF